MTPPKGGRAAAGIRIAFIGNPNNNHFALVRYLRDRGYDAHLLLTDAEQEHFHPKCDSLDTGYRDYTYQLSWGSEQGILRADRRRIRDDLAPYGVVVGTGYAAAYLAKAGVSLDVFDPYGWDIWNATFYRIASPRYQLRHSAAIHWQRVGLRRVQILHCTAMNEQYERQVARYFRNATRWKSPFPMVYAPQYESLADLEDRTHWSREFRAVRESAELMVVAPARQQWFDPVDPNTKGSDILVRGYARFCERNPSLESRLVLLEYGRDVKRTMGLVRDLGLDTRVVWMPKMSRKDLMVGMKHADVCCGQFGISWIQNGVLFEGLVAGKPILTWRDEARHPAAGLYPIYNANSPEAIADRLEEHLADPEVGRAIGQAGRRWYDVEVVEASLAHYARYIDTRARELGRVPN